MPATASSPLRISFDSTACGRCAGTGVVRPWGTCFRCGGGKSFLTRAGKAAKKRYNAWRDATLALALDETLVGQRAFIPQQFVGPQNGGQFLTFKGAREVLAISPTEGDDVLVTFRVDLGAAPSPWLRYDAEAKALTVHVRPHGTGCVNSGLYRAPTAAELEAVAPTLGKGATLVRPEAGR